MSVPYYLGAAAIAERLGYKDTKVVMRLHIERGFPMYKRAMPLKQGGYVRMWATSESAITAWELLQGQRSSQQQRQKRDEKAEQALHALKA
jgi:hypothetical protein